jgi:L-rhamnose-H+ transport protein
MELLIGLLLVMVSGAMAGSVMTPMKFMRKYRFEHYWVVYTLTGMVLIPWALAVMAVPDLLGTYNLLRWRVLVLPPSFAFSWGVASMLSGLCVSRIGLSLSYALVVGVGASAGLLVPISYFSPQTFRTPAGYLILLGVGVMIGGLALVTRAGQQRERSSQGQLATATNSASSHRNRYFLWVVLATVAGILSAGLNFSFAFGQEVVAAATAAGASGTNATYAVWSLAMTGGMLPNLAYSLMVCERNHSWRFFASSPKTDIPLGVLMGALFMGSTAVYGTGAAKLGVLGASVGWGIMQIMAIVVGNLFGFLTGEWKAAHSGSVRLVLAGLGVLVVASILMAFGNCLYVR